MIFLSAQPDHYYFYWQLELQILNFRQVGISKESIHILIGYNPVKGLADEFRNLIAENTGATFFTYPIERDIRDYPSSVRPHLIKQHILTYPDLQKTPVFYHDSDILFRTLPDFSSMLRGATWYVSDTRNYLDSFYIKKTANNHLFETMCKTVGVSTNLVETNDANCGGAQYLLKNTTYDFWDKVERDCISLYSLLETHNNVESDAHYLKTLQKKSTYKGIQSWCADMWAVLWNAWYFGYDVEIHSELDFCWPKNKIDDWFKTKILHYAGVYKMDWKKYFFKGNYVHYPPYYIDFATIDNTSCSLPLIQQIDQLVLEKKKERRDLRDVSFLIPIRIDSRDRLENLQIVVNYLDKFFDTNIIILEADIESHVNKAKLPSTCAHHFVADNQTLFRRTMYNNQMVHIAKTPYIVLYDSDAVFEIDQIQKAVSVLRSGDADFVTPYDGTVVGVDRIFKAIFGKILDPEVLVYNQGKFSAACKRSCGGAVFLNKKAFVAAGMENEKIGSWGPEDVERLKRMKILGHVTKKISGPLFHLPHTRSTNSGYCDLNLRMQLMEEYIKVSSMRKEELLGYISTWSWIKKS